MQHVGQVAHEAAQHQAIDRRVATDPTDRLGHLNAAAPGLLEKARRQRHFSGWRSAALDLLAPGVQQQRRHQIGQLEGLAQVAVHARIQTRLAIRRHRIGRHRNDGQGLPIKALANARGGRQTIHHGHLQVHQHRIEGTLGSPYRLHALLAVFGQCHLGALGHQKLLRDLPLVGVVFNHQQPHPLEAARRHGRRCTLLALGAIAQPGVDHRIENHGRGDRLDQEAAPRRLVDEALARQLLAALGRHHRQHHGLDFAARRTLPLAGVPGLDRRQLAVDEDRIARRACQLLCAQPLQRLRHIARHFDLPAHRPHHLRQQATRGGVVVDHEGAQPGHARCRRRRVGQRLSGSQRQPQLDAEGAAASWLAVELDAAAHQVDQPATDGQPETGAAKAACGGRLGLRKAAEDVGLLLRCDADAGVLNEKLEQGLGGSPFQGAHTHHHLAGFGELDGVGGQVDQHLLQPQIVAQQHARRVGVDIEHHVDVLVAEVGRQDHRELSHQPIDAEGANLERHLVGFDLGEIEDVVEQQQQRARGALALADVVALARTQRRGMQQPQHAQHRIERGADLVAHVGQELALGLVGLLGRLLGIAQLAQVFLTFADQLRDQRRHRIEVLRIVLSRHRGLCDRA